MKRKSDTKAAPSPRKKTAKIKKEKEVLVPSEEDEKENDLDTMEEKHDPVVEETKVNDTPRSGRTRGRINYKEDSDDEMKNSKRKLVKKTKSQAVEDLHVTGDTLEGYTDAMKEVLLKKKQKTSKKKNKKKSDEDEDVEEDMNGYNDEMKEIVTKKKSKKLKAVKRNSSTRATRQNNKNDVVNGDVDDSD